MIDDEVMKILAKDAKSVSDDERNCLKSFIRDSNNGLSEKEWADLIIQSFSVFEAINLEAAYRLLEDCYKEFSDKFPNCFTYRKVILRFVCNKHIEHSEYSEAHKIMDKLISVSLSEISYSATNHKMSYYSFRSFSSYSLDDIKKEQLSLCHPREFNDPLDTILVYWLNHAIDETKVSGVEFQYLMLLKKESENIKIRCLIGSEEDKIKGKSKHRRVEDLSFLMWSHYAHSHTGFCVEYEFERSLFEKDGKSSKIQLVDAVSYPDTISIDAEPDFKKALFQKSNFWKYEQEMRFVQFDPDSEVDYPTVDCKNMIKAVYLGVNCSEENKLKMIKAIGNKDIPLYQMQIDDSNVTRFRKIQIG